MILQTIISQSNIQRPPDLEGIQLVITGGIDITITSVLWFNRYLASDHPTINCDKKHFFLWGTDHASGAGGIYWGKGDNWDATDMVETGLIADGFQAETPYLYSVPSSITGDNEVVHFMFHTQAADPLNTNGIQESRLWTTTGGDLHTATWTKRSLVFPFQQGDTHLGYGKVFAHPVYGYRAIHLTQGGESAGYGFSNSVNGRDFVRDGTYNLTQGIQTGYEVKASYGLYFKKFGRDWFIGTIEPFNSSVGDVDKNLIIAKTNSDLQITEQIALLNNGEPTRNYEAHIEGDIASVFFQNPDNKIYHSYVDLNVLIDYL